MSGPDLSILTVPELRQLQRLARSRRDGAMKDVVEWELASRGPQSAPTWPSGAVLIAGGLAAGALLASATLWAAGGFDDWRLPTRSERPPAPQPEPPKPLPRPGPVSGSAVADVLAPEPFPERPTP